MKISMHYKLPKEQLMLEPKCEIILGKIVMIIKKMRIAVIRIKEINQFIGQPQVNYVNILMTI